MKVTVENNVNEYVLDRIKNVYIGFDDNTEVKLNQIVDFNIDLDNIDISTISLTNALENVEIINHFKGNKINDIFYVCIEAFALNPIDCNVLKVSYDIPCEMKIKRLRTDGGTGRCGEMYFELEGFVK